MYKESIITYMDIIGFKELLKKESAEAIEYILRSFQDASSPDKWETEYKEKTVTTFSDHIVMSLPIESKLNHISPYGVLWDAIWFAAWLQGYMIQKNTIFRGGITCGDICHTDSVVFGQGLVEAYKLESSVARFPRVIISPKLLLRLEKDKKLRAFQHSTEVEKQYVRDYIKQAEDGSWFIDYATAFFNELDGTNDGPMLFLANHKKVAEETAQKAADKDLLHRSASAWLLNYHNSVVERIPKERFKDDSLKKSSLIIGKSIFKKIKWYSGSINK